MSVKDAIMIHVYDEIERAQKLYPSTKHRYAAYIEEHGELCQAWLDFEYDKCSKNDLYVEAIQTMATLLRLLMEGDSNFKFEGLTIEEII